MKALPITLAFLATLTATTAASAQAIDLGKMSCKQFLIGDLVRRDYMALWLSGYYNGTRDDTKIDSGTVQGVADKVGGYCRSNLDASLMDAVKDTLGVGK